MRSMPLIVSKCESVDNIFFIPLFNMVAEWTASLAFIDGDSLSRCSALSMSLSGKGIDDV